MSIVQMSLKPILLIAVLLSTIGGFEAFHLHNPSGGSTFISQTPTPHSDNDADDVDGKDFDSLRRAMCIMCPALTISAAPSFAAVTDTTRNVDVGGGFDLLAPPSKSIAAQDVVFPVSMLGLWNCQRTVVSSEGDSFQATQAWKALGGVGSKIKDEMFTTRFVNGVDPNFVVLDRGFDISQRSTEPEVLWTPENPNLIQRRSIKLTVVQRSIEPPSDKGFGSNELYRIDDGIVTRAAQVKRRFRRYFDGDQNRVVEGLELIKTFRVLDGIAGMEIPTSTTKTMLRLTRP